MSRWHAHPPRRAGRGRPGGGPAGDLYVEVNRAAARVFVRDGDDLHCTIRVRWSTPALGTTVTLDTIIDGPPRSPSPRVRSPSCRSCVATACRSCAPRCAATAMRISRWSSRRRLDGKQSKLLQEFKNHRDRDQAEVVSTGSQNSGGLFSRLRDAFSAADRRRPDGCDRLLSRPPARRRPSRSARRAEGRHAATVRRIKPGERFAARGRSRRSRRRRRHRRREGPPRPRGDSPARPAAAHAAGDPGAGATEGRTLRTGSRTCHRGGDRRRRAVAVVALRRPLGGRQDPQGRHPLAQRGDRGGEAGPALVRARGRRPAPHAAGTGAGAGGRRTRWRRGSAARVGEVAVRVAAAAGRARGDAGGRPRRGTVRRRDRRPHGAGATAVLLGPTVLRTSTAAAVALGAIGVLTDRWSSAPID